MTLRLALIFAATALASASAFAQKPAVPKKGAPASNSTPPPEIKAFVESCSAHKFETTVEVSVDGKKRSSKVKLCGKEGQTDADWASTLKDAAKKIEANEKMAQAVKDQITTALIAEISKIEAANAVAIAPPAASPLEPATLPPSPPSLTTPTVATHAPLTTPAAAPRKPRLTIECSTPGERGGGGSCLSLEREMLLTIRADEDLAAGARLRFLRRGDIRGEVVLAQMRQGQSLRFNLPQQLCAGVASSKVEIQILGSGASGTGANQVLDTLGPYPLHC